MTSLLAFVVHDNPPKAVEPGKGAFYYPPFGDRHEAALSRWRTTRQLMLLAQGLHLLCETSFTGLVCQDAMQVASPSWAKLVTSRQQRLSPAAVMAIGRVYHDAPDASTRTWRLRPLMRLWASKPRCWPRRGANLTLWASTSASEGVSRRPCTCRSARLLA